MKKIILLFLTLTFISSCSGGRTLDIKSPCVSNDDGPCGPRKSINDWWLKEKGINS